MRGLTVRSQMTLWYGGILAAALLGFGVTLFFVMRHQLLNRVDAGLREELSDVLDEVQRATDSNDLLSWLDRRFARHEGFDFQITAEGGERFFVNQRLNDRRLPMSKEDIEAGSPTFQTVSDSAIGRYRIVAEESNGPDGPVVVQVARSLKDHDREAAELLMALLVTGPMVLLLAVGGGYFLARRALSSVDRMTTTAREIDARQFRRRLEIVNPHDEVGRLAQTLNGMLDRLEKSYQEMQRFTADASHELRTPISVIRTEAEVALDRPLSESEKQDLLGNILEECQRLTWITDQLLTLCREDAGIAQISREPVDFAQLVQGVTETIRPLAEGKSQRLTLAADVPAIVAGDSLRLRQVIYNLLDNAIKYTPPGGRLNLSVATVGHKVRLVVEDSGCGIPPEHLPHVFERFYRVDKVRSRAEGGAGLGLSIVHSIVSAHGGSVELASPPGRGTECTVVLPAVSDRGAPPTAESSCGDHILRVQREPTHDRPYMASRRNCPGHPECDRA